MAKILDINDANKDFESIGLFTFVNIYHLAGDVIAKVGDNKRSFDFKFISHPIEDTNTIRDFQNVTDNTYNFVKSHSNTINVEYPNPTKSILSENDVRASVDYDGTFLTISIDHEVIYYDRERVADPEMVGGFFYFSKVGE